MLAFWNLQGAWAGRKQVHQAAIGRLADPPQADGVIVLDADFEIVARLQIKPLTDRSRKDDLTLLREDGGHGGKILLNPKFANGKLMRIASAPKAIRSDLTQS